VKAPTRLELIEYAVARVREGATRHEIVKEVRMLSEETRTLRLGLLSTRTETVCMGLREAIDIVEGAERMASGALGVSR
jgi:hypothetical protein